MTPSNQLVENLLSYIDASPSPWHAVSTTVEYLTAAGFTELLETDSWDLEFGQSYYVIRDQSSIIAFVCGDENTLSQGFRIIGAHTDSPGFRIKPNPIIANGPWVKLGVEVYGGPILATFADRDLSLAGRVSIKSGKQIESQLVVFEKSMLRLPNLPIHLNRDVNKTGLKFNQQTQLPLILELAADGGKDKNDSRFKQLLASALEVESEQILAWEMAVYDVQKGSFFGLEDEFYANSQLDNLASCHAGLTALLDNLQNQRGSNSPTQLLAFFDHEEVGSESSKGADGSFLGDILVRISLAQKLTTEEHLQAIAKSYMLSADMAHAWHPNNDEKYDPEHRPLLNHGPVIKINSNQRYTTNSRTEALFVNICETAKIPYQKFVNRSDLSCGSTIGPLTAAKNGIASLDVGNPMWAMHSVRESAGVKDHQYMIQAMAEFLNS